jgi:decaprenyl-phosphate phosphoribosyltransferase
VLVGPAYGLVDGQEISWGAVAFAFLAFGLASSASYVVNDLRDREADRLHPRKRRRPIASGEISQTHARTFAGALFIGAIVSLIPVGLFASWEAAGWLSACLGAYIANVTAYSLRVKHVAILDVMSLSLGFVLRVLGGCASVAIMPSAWLLNSTFFLSMFLAFGKRLGERRTLGDDADGARPVQTIYTDHLLRMMVVMTAVATLVTYSGYVQDRSQGMSDGLVILWLTMLPATFALLRCIVVVERGQFDDPTELAAGDPPFQLAAALFAGLTLLAFTMWGP